MKVLDKIKFAEEKQAYTIQALGPRFAVCTKPFNLKHTVLYSVVDFKEKVRGTENLIFGAGAETRGQCEEMLTRLETGETEVSHRNRIPLKMGDMLATSMTNQAINEEVARKLGYEPDRGQIFLEGKYVCVPNFCESIEAAWGVVEWIHDNGGKMLWKSCFELSQSGNGWLCRLRMAPWEAADTAPMAICLAFLKLP